MRSMESPRGTGSGWLVRILVGIPISVAAIAVAAQHVYDQAGERRFVSNTAVLERNGENNRSEKIVTPRAQVQAVFTNQTIAVDGVRESAWNGATAYPIANRFNADMTAAVPDASTRGTLRALWDGPVLYLLV
jgi:hypothetical protein